MSRVVLWILALFPAALAAAQTTKPAAADPADFRFALLTMGPGRAVYERFGHNAIIVEGPPHGDVAFNYGVFSFEQPNFLGRFIEGKMMYTMAAQHLGKTVDEYRGQRRWLLRQDLSLTPDQKRRLWDTLVAEHDKPYLYNYYDANCSTKVRDALDRATGGRLAATLKPAPTPTTYRYHTRRIFRSHPPLYLGTHYVLGQPIDRSLSAWEESFLPARLAHHLRDTGLVAAEQSLSDLPVVDDDRPPDWRIHFLVVGLLIAGVLVFLARSRFRRTLGVAAVAWAFIAGGAGVFLLWAFTSDHWAVYRNENLLQFSPLTLPLVVLVPMLIRGGKLKFFWTTGLAVAGILALAVGFGAQFLTVFKPLGVSLLLCAAFLTLSDPAARRLALPLAVAAPLLSVLGLLLKLSPAFYQHNAELIALALPANVGLAAAVLLLLRRNPEPQPRLSK